MCTSNPQYYTNIVVVVNLIFLTHKICLKQPSYTLFFEWLCAKIWTQSFGTLCSFINSRLI